MAGVVIDKLAYIIEADTRQFAAGVTLTKQELRAVAAVARETATPLENHAKAVRNLDGLLAKGAISQEQYNRALAKMKAELRGAAGEARQLGSAVASGAAKLGGMAAAGIGGIAAAGIAGVAATAVQGVRLASDAETAQVQFRVLLGDAQRARSLLGEIKALADATPFQSPELRDAARGLLAYGVAADAIPEKLRRLGDIAAGTGQRVGDLAAIYGKMLANGRIMGDDLNQLADRGIPIVAALAKEYGIAESEVRKLVEGGSVGFASVERAIASMTDEGGKFAGMMDEMSQTAAGKFSTMLEKFNDVARALGEGVLPSLTKALDAVTPALERMAKSIEVMTVDTTGTAAEQDLDRVRRDLFMLRVNQNNAITDSARQMWKSQADAMADHMRLLQNVVAWEKHLAEERKRHAAEAAQNMADAARERERFAVEERKGGLLNDRVGEAVESIVRDSAGSTPRDFSANVQTNRLPGSAMGGLARVIREAASGAIMSSVVGAIATARGIGEGILTAGGPRANLAPVAGPSAALKGSQEAFAAEALFRRQADDPSRRLLAIQEQALEALNKLAGMATEGVTATLGAIF